MVQALTDGAAYSQTVKMVGPSDLNNSVHTSERTKTEIKYVCQPTFLKRYWNNKTWNVKCLLADDYIKNSIINI